MAAKYRNLVHAEVQLICIWLIENPENQITEATWLLFILPFLIMMTLQFGLLQYMDKELACSKQRSSPKS